MVGPISQGERDAFNRKLQVGVAVLVAGSMALVALGAGATLVQTALAAVVGVLVGGVISWYIVPTGLAPAEKQRVANAEPDNPFTDGGGGGNGGGGSNGGGDGGDRGDNGGDRSSESDPDDGGRRASKPRSRR
jgi:uncharacterized membrane protein YgcG